ncbi:MAG TPA: tetratricopeptide repeat protein [Candidatus Limnocylindrales bacterium]|nr:tetratricopeptide repeat protein [Candidatus Limnocylindrales bacterium]
MLEVRILGRTRLWREGRELDLGPAGRRAVFGLLVLAGGRPLARHEFIDALWGEQVPSSATNVLQTHVKHLRRILEPQRPSRVRSELLPAVGDGYALALGDADVDMERFRRLGREAAQAASEGEPERVASLLGEALKLWEGPPLADVPALATYPKVTVLAAERRQALARYAEAKMALGHAGEVLTLLEEEAAAHPLDESAQARLVRAYGGAGHRSRGFEIYESARHRLAEELGVDPGAELTAAHLDLLREEPGPRRRPVRQLPADVPGFTGREAELARLDAALDGCSPLVVCGTAGVGKTALAVHWGHRVASRFPDGQLYVDLRGYDPRQTMPADDALARLLHALGVPPREVPEATDERSSRYRTEVADKQMLIVLDNASSVDQIRPLLPGTQTSLVVVTSRDSLAGLVALDGAQRVELDLLPEDDAVCLLRRLIGRRVDEQPGHAKDLAHQCARLPLALRVAAELAAASPAMSLAELVAELADRHRRLDVLDPGGDVRAAVRTVLSWSVQRLTPEAALVFRRLGLHPGPHFDARAVAALVDIELGPASRLLTTLARAHLVQPLGHGRFAQHDLLRAHAAELTATEDPYTARENAIDRLLDDYLACAHAASMALYPAWRGYRHGETTRKVTFTEPQARAWLDAQLPGFGALCAFAAAHARPDHAIGLATNLHRYLESGHHLDALTVGWHALTAARAAGNRHAQAHVLTNLGDIHRLLGRYPAAIEHHRQALALHRETGDRHGQARTLSDLGIVHDRLGQYHRAAQHHRQALVIYAQLDDRYGEAAALTNLSNAHKELGRREEAADGYLLAREIFRDLGDRAGQGIALTNLGDVYAGLGRYPQASQRLGEALDLFRSVGHRDGEATALSNLGALHIRLGSLSAAIATLREALEIFRATGHRYGEASVLNKLAEALTATGDRRTAQALYGQAFEIATQTGDLDEQIRAQSGLSAAYR